MHPELIQAAAAERTRERHSQAAARQRAAEIGRSRRARRPQRVVRLRQFVSVQRASRLLRAA
jgi:hypothetical protein